MNRTALTLLVSATLHLWAVQDQPAGFPDRLATYLGDTVRLTAAERRQLLNGQPVTKMLDADPSKEVAVFGAVWINAPARRYVDAVNDIETFERGGGFKVTRRISEPPRLADFSELRLPDADLDALRSCRVGDCDVKLGAPALERFQSEIDWRSPAARAAANRLMQQIAFEYVTRYLERGNDGLAVYRDHSPPISVAQEFRTLVEAMPSLSAYLPDVRRYLLEYPGVTIPETTSFLYWQETTFGLKPTIRISHVTIREGPDDTVVTSKMLYATHYFLTGLELRVLVPDTARGPGFWFVTVNRSRADGLTGLRGMFVRPRVRSQAKDMALAALRSTKQRLELPR
jgi:hypothetical protein